MTILNIAPLILSNFLYSQNVVGVDMRDNLILMEAYFNDKQRMGKDAVEAVKKTGRLLEDLRREIDDWHGDILAKGPQN